MYSNTHLLDRAPLLQMYSTQQRWWQASVWIQSLLWCRQWQWCSTMTVSTDMIFSIHETKFTIQFFFCIFYLRRVYIILPLSDCHVQYIDLKMYAKSLLILLPDYAVSSYPYDSLPTKNHYEKNRTQSKWPETGKNMVWGIEATWVTLIRNCRWMDTIKNT